MKKLVLTLLILSGKLLAQSPGSAVQVIEKQPGRTLLTQQELPAREFIFSERIHTSSFDTTLNLFTVQLRGVRNEKWLNNRGTIMALDLQTAQIRWSKKVNYQTEGYQQIGTSLIKSGATGSRLLNRETGEPMAKVKHMFYHVDAPSNIGMGYESLTDNVLEGIDLTTGQKLWERVINREYSWNNLHYLNDSTLLIVAAGLHTIHVPSGTGWDYHAVTGQKKYGGTIAKNALGIAAGLLTGVYMTSTGHDLVRNVASNVLLNEDKLYFASKDKIVCLDMNGEMMWSGPLPEKSTSKSTLFIRNKRLILVNSGFAYMGYRKLDYGKPFLAAFDPNTGEEIYNHPLQTEKENDFGDFTVQDSSLYYIAGQNIERYSIHTGLKTGSTSVQSEGFSFLGDHIYEQQNDSTYQSITGLHPDRLYLVTREKSIVGLDENLENVETKEAANAWIYYQTISGYRFLSRNNLSIVINQDGEKVAEFEGSGRSTLIGNKLYTIHHNSVLETDLSALLDPPLSE
ncbi:hypothetical protein [Telluribacter sp. SYSU D00476]|uniref:hypothetical protein n=1 Tax=Telluribacter sp. SYSU D00476 TaxID=2811430 RepID=UPI001FF3142B|nr:hypothetical protein [Telluribacter sp. SYSU D00476]